MSKTEMQALAELIELVRGATEYDELTKQRVIARLRHNHLLQYVTKGEHYNVNLPLSTRIEAFLNNKHDAMYGNAMAHRLGFQANEGILTYDVTHLPLAWSKDSVEPYARYLRNLGCTSMCTDHVPAQDGLNHYNIYSQAKTCIGRMASNFESARDAGFDTPHGKFKTLEGYYHVLRLLDYFASTEAPVDTLTTEERLAHDLVLLSVHSRQYPDIDALYRLEGAACIRVGREVKRDVYGGTRYRPGAFSTHAERCFMTALVNKLQVLKVDGRCLGNVLAEIVHQRVPLDHYYVMNGQIVRPKFSEWLPELITTIVEYIDPYADTFDTKQVMQQLW